MPVPALGFLILPAALALSGAAGAGPVVAIGDLLRGQPATVTGEVLRLTDEDTFVLRDATGSVAVYLGPDRVRVTPGEVLTIEGAMDDDPGPPELYARRLLRADGTVQTLRQED